VLVIWEQPNEPFRKIALLSDGQVRHSRQPATRFGSLVAPPHEAASVRVDTSRSAEAHPEGDRVNAPRLDPELCATFQIRTALTAPFERDGCYGRVFVIDPMSATDDDLLIVKLIARRIGVDLEHYLLRHEIQRSTALRERERLGQDLHDGLLQSLAAADIRLKLSADRVEGDLRAELEQTRSLLADEQNRIRAFVAAHRPLPKPPSKLALLYDPVAERVRDLGRQWNCEVTLDVYPRDLQVQSALAQHLRHLLSEAVSNAARHGPSSRIHIAIARSEGSLSLTVTDNGKGFPGLGGSYDGDELRARGTGPISVLSRVADLAGTLKLESSPAGSRIEINLPL